MAERLTQLLQLLNEMPNDPFLKYGIGLEYQSKNDDTFALKYFSELKASNPEYLALYYQLGKLYERINQNEEAVKIYTEGIELARQQKDLHTMSELQNALEELS